MDVIHIYVFLTLAVLCNGVNIYEIMATPKKYRRDLHQIPKIMRRFSLNREPSVILGAPTFPHHLPPAEPILPGHTLIRPAVGMLKSSIKFPHREQENGSGVYGYFENLGIKYNGKNERVLYTGFRRSLPPNNINMRRMPNSNNMYRKKGLWKKYSNYQKKKQYSSKLRNPEYNVLGQIVLVKRVKTPDLIAVLRMINSLRRDQDKEEKAVFHIPGKAKFGFGTVDPDSDDETTDKTTMFWKTKGAFNHVKIRPDAPDFSELNPGTGDYNQRNWWFYHQSDFEEGSLSS